MFPVIGHCGCFYLFSQFFSGQCFSENLHVSYFIFLLGLLLMGNFHKWVRKVGLWAPDCHHLGLGPHAQWWASPLSFCGWENHPFLNFSLWFPFPGAALLLLCHLPTPHGLPSSFASQPNHCSLGQTFSGAPLN